MDSVETNDLEYGVVIEGARNRLMTSSGSKNFSSREQLRQLDAARLHGVRMLGRAEENSTV